MGSGCLKSSSGILDEVLTVGIISPGEQHQTVKEQKASRESLALLSFALKVQKE